MTPKNHFSLLRGVLPLALLAAALQHGTPAFAESAFTIAVIGDQQVPVNRDHYTQFYSSFTAQTDWIAANAQANNIRFVSQVGDIVEHGEDLNEYGRAVAAMAGLDTATDADGGTGIPWHVAFGNHEVNWGASGSDPAGARADNYRNYFGSGSGTHRYAGQPEYGGVSSNDLNTWHIIKSSNTVGAHEYLMLNLEYDAPGHKPGTTPNPADVPAFDAIAWAWDIIAQHPGMPTIITTHVFEGTNYGPPNNPYTAGPGRNSQIQIFDKLVKDNPQIFMVLSGHTSEDSHQVKNNAAGLPVLQMVTDYNKWISNGGNGYMRLVELDKDAGEIRVKTYTPGIPSYSPPTPAGYRTDANGQFTMTMDWATRFADPAPPEPEVLRGPYLQAAAHDRMTVRWRTDIAGIGVVRYGTTPGVLDQSASPGTAETEHVVTITGLLPNTVYYYAIDTQNGATTATVGDDANHFFKTHPTPGTSESTRVWVIGDSGMTTTAKQDVYDAYKDRGEATDVWLMLGDNAYNNGTDAEFQAAVFDSYPELLRNTPLWSCIGNHEAYTSGGQPYLDLHTFPTAGESGGVASGTERYYSFDYGDIHFVCIDSQTAGNYDDTPGGGGMVDWLELDLQATDKQWIIAYFHHGPYTKGSHDSDTETQHIVMRQYVVPLLEQYGVDLVLSGHSHCYERSMLINGHHSAMSTADSTSGTFDPLTHIIDGGNGSTVGSVDGTGTFVSDGGDGAYEKLPPPDKGGTVYTTCGASGKLSAWDNGSTAVVNPAPHPVFMVNLRVMGSMIIDVDGETLNARYIDGSNTVRDDFTIRKIGAGLFLSAATATAVTDDGATVESQLYNVDADEVTAVWAYADQGETTVADWTSAPGGGSHSFGATSEGTVLSHVLTGLDGDTAYSVRFFATAGTDTTWSALGNFATGLGSNPAPTGLNALAGTTTIRTKVDLTWTDSYAHENGFLIQRSTDSGFASYDEFSVGADQESYTDNTTAPKTTYYYRIAATGSTGTGTFSSAVSVTTGDDPVGAPVPSLIGHWTFDEGSGTTTADSSANGNTATLAGDAGSWVTGASGSAYQLAGTNTRFELADSSDLRVTGAVTVSAWVKPVAASRYGVIAGIDQTGGTASDMYTLKTGAGDELNWQVIGTSSSVNLTGGTLMSLSNNGADWVHVVGVYDPSGFAALYVNGSEVASTTTGVPTSIQSKTTDFQIGHNAADSGYPLKSAVDDVQVYDQALTATDVAFLYSNPGYPLTSTPTPPFGNWATTNITDIDPTADATFIGNPDGDSFANGFEWALGGGPLGFDSMADLLGYDATSGLTFTFTREDASEGEANLTVEFSSDLFDADVNLSSIPAASGTVGGVIYTIQENGSAPDDVTATIPEGNAAAGKLFGRLRATEN